MQEIMNGADIAFPHLGIYLENVPKSFGVFGFTIALYAVIIAIGMMAGLFTALCLAKRTGQDPDIYWDLFIFVIIFSVIGARLYYVAFSWDLYKDNLLSIFYTRNGGMAIYGGVIAAFITLFVFCRIKKLNPLKLGDTAIPGLVLGQIIGRWGNFMNREAFGEYTDSLFAMRLPIEAVRPWEITENISAHIAAGTNYIQVHPTFLYESLWNLALLILMLLYFRRKRFHGEMCLIYFAGYGLGRFLIEGLRTDQLLIHGTQIAVSQVLSVCMVVLAVAADLAVRVLLHKGKLQLLIPKTVEETAVKPENEAE